MKLGNIRKVSNPRRMKASPVSSPPACLNTRSALFHMKTRISPKYVVNNCGELADVKTITATILWSRLFLLYVKIEAVVYAIILKKNF